MNKKQTIAGVVLTLNEEQNLARSLESLSWCDEILVVDSGSTDCTKDVSYQFGAQFVQHVQPQPFLITEQRNWALHKAGLKSDWVLFLDADEEVSCELAAQIRLCINSPNSAEAYELTPWYWFLGKWLKRTQGYPNWHPRLIKRGYARFEGGVWERFSSGATISRIKIPYEHYAFSKGINDWLERHIRYADAEAHDLYRYLAHVKNQPYVNSRKSTARTLMASIWPLRPLIRFSEKYLLRAGFLEGWQALVFSLLMAFYELIIVLKYIEARRRDNSLAL